MKSPKRRAVATRAFSPPERRSIFWSFFPGGCAMISIPVVEGSSSSKRIRLACPPLKSLVKTSLNFSLTKWKVSKKRLVVVRLIRMIAFFRESRA